MRHVGKAHRKRIVSARGTADPHAEPGTDADEDCAEQGCGKRHIGKLRPQGRKLLTDPVRQGEAGAGKNGVGDELPPQKFPSHRVAGEVHDEAGYGWGDMEPVIKQKRHS